MAKQTKQLIDPDHTARPAFVLADHYARLNTPPHSHRRAQLIHVSAGVVTVTADGGRWLVPPHRGLWLPPVFAIRFQRRSLSG